MARKIIQNLVNNIKKSSFCVILTDDRSFVKFLDVDKGKADTAFLDCLDIL